MAAPAMPYMLRIKQNIPILKLSTEANTKPITPPLPQSHQTLTGRGGEGERERGGGRERGRKGERESERERENSITAKAEEKKEHHHQFTWLTSSKLTMSSNDNSLFL